MAQNGHLTRVTQQLDPSRIPDAALAAASDEELEAAGTAVVLELVRSAPHDLRDEIPAPLRAEDYEGEEHDKVGAGCGCGCGENELLASARAGDEAALSEILRRYRALARYQARAYFIAGADRDDVQQEAMIGIYKAIRDFDPDRGASFRTFAELCVQRQILTAVKAATRLKHGPMRTASSLDVEDAEGRSWHERLAAPASADPAEATVAAEQLAALQGYIQEVLSDLERQVLRHHFEGKSYEEIAGLLQRHAKSVDNALQRIRRKLQERLAAGASAAG